MDRELSALLETPTPQVSVIVPIFNKSAYLTESINSVLSQGYSNLEILARDDGSTDSSPQVMEEIARSLPPNKFKSFRGINMGASYTRNFLIERASSRLVILMDADDIMLPGFIDAAIAAMRAHGAQVVYSDVELFGVKEGEWCPQAFDQYAIRYDNCLTSLALIDKEIWRKIGGYENGLPFNEDWSFFVRASQITQRFHKLPKKYFRYRQTSLGLYHSFIQDNWALNLASVMIASPDLYAVDEVINSVNVLMRMPAKWIEKFEDVTRKHPNSVLPQVLLGISALGQGNNVEAANRFQQAIALSGAKEWISLLLMGEQLERQDINGALSCFHQPEQEGQM